MKTLTIIATAFILAASALQAQNTSSQAGSNATASNSANSGSVAAITFNTPSNQTVTSRGSTTTRLESAPSLGGLALGGGHPCAWTPGSGQISVIGGGLGGAAMEIDSACLMMVMGASTGDRRQYEAAIAMIASRDPAACKAYYGAGLVADCVDRNGKSTVRSAPKARTPSTGETVGYSKCTKNGGTVYIKYLTNANKATAKAQCLAALGY